MAQGFKLVQFPIALKSDLETDLFSSCKSGSMYHLKERALDLLEPGYFLIYMLELAKTSNGNRNQFMESQLNPLDRGRCDWNARM